MTKHTEHETISHEDLVKELITNGLLDEDWLINGELVPNEETIEAIEESNRVALDPNIKGYTDVDKLFNDLAKDVVSYNALFSPEAEGGFTVIVPDIEEVVTYGETIEEAIAMAKECMWMCLDQRMKEGTGIPQPSKIIPECPKNCFYVLIEIKL